MALLPDFPYLKVAPRDPREHTGVLPVAALTQRVQHLEAVEREVRAGESRDERHLE